ncbi:diguanylate cyclase [Caballeronia arationis]|jgi:diguanylate cyclase (GGDEF)-like protein|uniref:Diguanylate cyclase with GAF sensor n=1 Tax=Caballeronia arationis TaxID=1777142 RepID=A0A7Z7I4J1_9BURK|nr:sensor domain-containing diguanylate cyclase [Caballeronia arationis]SAK47694.1 diguanylate cyclase [Caballeronia arationis]SOE59584.1 diguanylate cyclase with GAF sensor [Caballeronia arationis]
MLIPPKPANESARIETLRSLKILDTAPEERFDRLTRLAKRLFGVPIALVSLVDENRQWFKSCVGLEATETPRDVSFCAHAIAQDDILLIPDARADERFHDNPLVVDEPGIRFYAGCPLTVPNGSKLGTLCLIDVRPRELDDEDRALLRDLACMAEQELAAVQLATMDELTLLSNRRGFEALAQHALNVCRRLERQASLLFFDLNDFKQINDTYGHAEGDRALATFAEVLRSELRDSDVIGRLGGDEFVALLTDAQGTHTEDVVARLHRALTARNRAAERGYDIRFSVGHTDFDPARHASIADLLASSDSRMYAHKQSLKSAARGARH